MPEILIGIPIVYPVDFKHTKCLIKDLKLESLNQKQCAH